MTAFTVEVCCPWCGDQQPAPNGSHFWDLGELGSAAGETRKCVACDEDIRFVVPSSAKVIS